MLRDALFLLRHWLPASRNGEPNANNKNQRNREAATLRAGPKVRARVPHRFRSNRPAESPSCPCVIIIIAAATGSLEFPVSRTETTIGRHRVRACAAEGMPARDAMYGVAYVPCLPPSAHQPTSTHRCEIHALPDGACCAS